MNRRVHGSSLILVLCACVSSCDAPDITPTGVAPMQIGPPIVHANEVNGDVRVLSGGTVQQRADWISVSGTQFVWTDITQDKFGNPTIYRLFTYDVATNAIVQVATGFYVADIDAGRVGWIDPNTGGLVLRGGVSGTYVESDATGIPSIHGRYAAWIRDPQDLVTETGVRLLDLTLGTATTIVDDDRIQSRPRVGDDYVVYEDYDAATFPENGDIKAYRISTGESITVAAGAASQTQPDIDGHTVVYVQSAGGTDQLFAFDLDTHVTQQLTTVPSTKAHPRISGSRVVWADDRNGDFDIYGRDLATGQEVALVRLPDFQGRPDIDGNRVVYTDNLTGYYRVALFTIGGDRPAAPVVQSASTLRSNQAIAVSARVLPSATLVNLVAAVATVNGVARPPFQLLPRGDDMYEGAMTGFGAHDVITLDVFASGTGGAIGPPTRLIVSNNGGDRTVPCQSAAGADVAMDASGSTGAAGLSLTYQWLAYPPLRVISDRPSLTPLLPIGTTLLMLNITDIRPGFVAGQSATIVVDRSCLSP
ncbi:MAG TPA: hypothetical protein VKH19_03040 [Gemmatimonadaceae bacterium]|nr:hypothetical protein [Gemmatimonadaceae bacterium]